MYGAVLFKSAKEFQKKLKYLKENPLEVELIANNAIDRILVRKLIHKIRSKIKSSNPK